MFFFSFLFFFNTFDVRVISSGITSAIFSSFLLKVKHPQCIAIETVVSEVHMVFLNLLSSLSLTGIMSATGNGYVMYMTIKRKTKLKPPELMTLNLAIFDFGISGMGLCLLTIRVI